MADGTSGATVSVDTAALDTFAGDVGQLAPQVTALIAQLSGVDVEPGAFPEADQLKSLINGGGLSGALTDALKALGQGLDDLAAAAHQMSADYSAAEDANSVTAGDVQSALSGFDADIASLQADLQ